MISLFKIKQKSQREDKKACYSSEDRGGLSDIRAKLFQYRGRLSILQAGGSFDACLAKENVASLVRAFLRCFQLSNSALVFLVVK